MQQNFISLSTKAKKRLEQIFKENSQSKGLRIYIQGGGCSGFEYNFELVNNFDEDDLVTHFTVASIKFFVCTDELSGTLLEGSELDFLSSLTGARFVVQNPNVSSQCSCGSSFSVG